jgi:hypothetical protein
MPHDYFVPDAILGLADLSDPCTAAIQQERGLNRDATIWHKKGEGAKLRDKSAGSQ